MRNCRFYTNLAQTGAWFGLASLQSKMDAKNVNNLQNLISKSANEIN